MRAHIVIYLLTGLLSFNGFALSASLTSDNKINLIKQHIVALTAEAMQGRLAGSVGEMRAANYVADNFKYLNLSAAGDDQTYFQNFTFNQTKHLVNPNIQKQKNLISRNVLAKLILSEKNAPLIVIGAHLDHVGRGEYLNSRATLQEFNRFHPGADDNASGVACVLALAAQLAELKQQGKLSANKNILFAIWSGEEIGLLGSTYFMRHNLHKNIVAYVNLDMVGRMRKKLIIQGVGSSFMWSSLLQTVNKKHALPLLLQRDPYLPTDTTSFYLRNIPSLNFFTGAHDDYHTPRDTLQQLNFAGLNKINQFLLDFTLALLTTHQAINYHAVAEPKLQLSYFKIYLGTVPDYTYNAKGVRLSGVTKSSPADKAKLKADDIIVSLKGKPIQNIYDYTNILNTLIAGQLTSLNVLRYGKLVHLTIVPQARE
jgi:Zn-dependent M28 family amino/carboxypeptidase